MKALVTGASRLHRARGEGMGCEVKATAFSLGGFPDDEKGA
jgi:hypothetical protein